MASPFARLAPLGIALCLAAARPALAASVHSTPPAATGPSDLFLDWLSGWDHGSSEARGSFFRVGLDPETGEWGHAPLDRSGLGLSGVPAPAIVIHRADGSTEILVDPTWVDYLIARIGPDGRPVLDCAPTRDVGSVLATPASGAPDR